MSILANSFTSPHRHAGRIDRKFRQIARLIHIKSGRLDASQNAEDRNEQHEADPCTILPATGNLVKKAAYAQMRTMADEVKTERTAEKLERFPMRRLTLHIKKGKHT